jgi:aminoacylase
MLSAGNPDAATPQFNVIVSRRRRACNDPPRYSPSCCPAQPKQPTEATAGVDIRIPATTDLVEFSKTLDSWCAVEGGNVSWEPLPLVCGAGALMTSNPTTPVEGPDAHWYRVFSGALRDGALETHAPSIFPAATDSRWVRLMLGAPCLGFSPMRNTPILLHDHDEYISVGVFNEGIAVYERIIERLANDDSAR